jgi:hypothetical protein
MYVLNKRIRVSGLEGYKLQPAKSVIINIQPNKRKQSMMDQEYILENNVMPNVKQAIHLGIIRTSTLADNMTVNVEENIKKSRRIAYGLFITIMTCVSCSRLLISATSSAHALALQFTFPIFIPRYESLRLFEKMQITKMNVS